MSSGMETGQYRAQSVHRYEWIFGRDFLSAGGIEAVKDLLRLSPISSGMRVLDVGSGLGGAAFYLNTELGAHVCGVDVLESMVNDATSRAKARGLRNVRFICGDILTLDSGEGGFDVVWSRDAFLHIADKDALFRRLVSLMRPGAKLVFTDYGRGGEQGEREFEDYARGSAYSLHSAAQYGDFMKGAGFVDVTVRDETGRFVGYIRREMERLENTTDLRHFGIEETDRTYLLDRWRLKLRCCESGDMKWFMVTATRP